MGEVETRANAHSGQPLAVHKDGLRFFPGANAVLGPLNALVNWGRCGSIWPVTFGLACCAIEMMTTGASTHDLDRFGIIFRAGRSPGEMDCMVVAGTLSKKMAPVLRRVYDQMPEHACCSRRLSRAARAFSRSYAVTQGVDQIIPVDVYVPGCPPRPEALFDGFIKLQEKINKGNFGWSWR